MKFVKLGVADPTNHGGEPRFYRRIPLADSLNGGLSFLKRHAVLLARQEVTGDIRNVNLNEYTIQLHYTDEEGDKILLCNDVDIRDAMQFGMVSLKIAATVEELQPSTTKATQTASPTTTETGTQPNPQPNVVDALADVLNCVAASANAGLAAVERSLEELPTHPVPQPGVPKAARTSSEALQHALEQASAHATKATHYAERKVQKAVQKVEKQVSKTVQKVEKQVAKTERKVEEALAAISKAVEGKPPARIVNPFMNHESTTPTPESLFIHGRHTCDACLTTPIIGERYHATNMTDYDLCAKCHEQYKGSEITFEVAQLDRDVGMQDRWRLKYARMEGCGGRRGRGTHRTYHASPGGHGPWRAPEGCPLPQNGPNNIPACFVGPPPLGPMPPLFGTVSHVEQHNDMELEQALRRSLAEFEAKVVASASAPKEEQVLADETPKPTTESVANVTPEETCDEEASVVEDNATASSNKAVEIEPDIVVQVPVKSVVVESTPDVAVEIPVESRERVPKVVCSPVEDSHRNVTEAGETIMSGRSIPSPKSAANTSFVEQDLGSIGHYLGETLDRVGSAIDNLMIVDGSEDDDEEEESQGSWSVVNEDENLARAAEMIGSALFHSDNNVGSQFSSVSSVPTHVTNVVHQAQYHRWSFHLERLHELGFDDDVENISVLEMLMAANIGVGSDDEDVTIEQVVHALMMGK